uniref:Uncharacterized protein n=1 Tax=Avena sativa TaxID=4498 RepID=A0ACD6ADF5_AVESA
MFGPESASDGWAGLPFVFDKVRVGDCPARLARAEAFLDIFAREGCVMEEMPCCKHDELAAETQLLTHTVGRMLALLNLRATPIDTKGFESLLQLVDNTCSDSFDLYNGLFMYNKNSMELLNRLQWALDTVKKRLFDNLHEVLRRQLFEGSPPLNRDSPDFSSASPPLNRDSPDSSSASPPLKSDSPDSSSATESTDHDLDAHDDDSGNN